MQRVPCPWCQKPNDFRVLADNADKAGGISGWGSQGLENGAIVDCDHCGKFAKVIGIETVQVVKLTPVNGSKG
jgi:hypothetical protein